MGRQEAVGSDLRQFGRRHARVALEVGQRAEFQELRGGRVEVAIGAPNAFTGSASCIRPLAKAPKAGSSPVARALAWTREATAAMAASGDVLEWAPDPRTYVTGAGRRVVYLHQQYRGIPVFEAMRTVIFGAEEADGGRLHEVVGDHVALRDGLPLEPQLGAADAVLVGARHLADSLEAAACRLTLHPPRVMVSHGLPAAPTVLHKLPFEDPVVAHLTYFDLGDDIRLAWTITLHLSGSRGSWQLIVEAAGEEAGRVLWSRNLLSTARAASGSVWPYDPGVSTGRLHRSFPPDLSDLPALRPRRLLPADFPRLWVADQGTSGNNVEARPLGGRIFAGVRAGGMVVFTPSAPEGSNQRTLNAFYWCNQLHDVFYLLGFDESAGNFQEQNPDGSPRGGDRIRVRIVDQIAGDAVFVPAEDGRRPKLTLGTTAAGRHTALSADVVYHEVVHGLTNRLVGGDRVAHPMKQSFQSSALDEGTCDYFALTLQNHARLGEVPPRPERLVFGAWVARNDVSGLRKHSYDPYPLRFADLPGHPDLATAHDAGQVWCAALLTMNRRLGDVLGDTRHGHELGWQLVVDALRETARTPLAITYLKTRDRILEALAALRAASPDRADGRPLLPPAVAEDAQSEVQAAFAGFGMGPAASGESPDFRDAISDS